MTQSMMNWQLLKASSQRRAITQRPADVIDSPLDRLQHYLEQSLLRQQDHKALLPSIDRLKAFFGVSPEDVKTILKQLHRQGFRYRLESPHHTILIWDTLVSRALQRRAFKHFSIAKMSQTLLNPLAREMAKHFGQWAPWGQTGRAIEQ